MILLTVRENLLHKKLSEIQRLQLKAQLSILTNLLIPLLYNPRNFDQLTSRVNDSEKIYFGVKEYGDFLSKLTLPLYIASRFFIASSGPRAGKMLEDLICSIIKEKGRYTVYQRSELSIYFPDIKERRQIDYILDKDDKVYFIEQRTSEHTGGKTAQESLLDKFRIITDKIITGNLGVLKDKKKEIHMRIFILFNEKQELISRGNMSKGRLTSLINYIMEEDNLGRRFKELSFMFPATECFDLTSNKSESSSNLRSCLEKGKIIYWKGNKVVSFGILLGDEFFKELLGTDYENVKNELLKSELGDDLWIMYSLLPYEMRNYYLNGFTWTRKLYDEIVKNFKIDDKVVSEDELIRSIREKIISDEKFKNLNLIESTDLKQQVKYLEYLIAAALIIRAIGPVEKVNKI